MHNFFIKLLAAGLLLGAPAFAFAQNVDATADASVRTGTIRPDAYLKAEVKARSASTTIKARAVVEDKAKDRANQEIDRRLKLLGNLSDRLEGAVKVTGETKASILANLEAQINALVALKAKIKAETSTTTLREHIKSITGSYRIFALVAPKASIAAYADRLNVLAGQMTDLGVKLQARIDAATGIDKSAAIAAMADFNAKVAEAKLDIKAALDLVAPLQPDNEDAAIAASNRAKLQEAKAKLEEARRGLEAAREDISAIRNALPKVRMNATTSAEVR